MELRHLEYFVAVAEEGSFTRAAQRLHVVQSGVSASIKALERDLGARLLDRDSKRVQLTDAGTALLPRAREVIDAVQAARDAVGEVEGGLSGTLRIGTLTSVPIIDLPALLGRYHREHPGVTIKLTAAPSGSAGLAAAITDGTLDLAFVSLADGVPGARLRQLASIRLDLVVPAAHPLATRRRVRLADLADQPFIDFPVGYGNRTVTDRAFATAGLSRQVAIEITDIATGAAYIRHGVGLALLPRFIVSGQEDLRSILVTGADLQWPLSVAVPGHRRLSAATRTLLELITQAAITHG